MYFLKLGLFFLLASSVYAEQAAQWIARSTRNLSCYNTGYGELDTAVQEAKALGLDVRSARVGYLKDIFQCMACGCPEGTYYFIEVESHDRIDNLIVGHDFSIVREEKLWFKTN